MWTYDAVAWCVPVDRRFYGSGRTNGCKGVGGIRCRIDPVVVVHARRDAARAERVRAIEAGRELGGRGGTGEVVGGASGRIKDREGRAGLQGDHRTCLPS